MPYLQNCEKKVFYRKWDIENPKADVVFIHGVGEYSGLYHRFAHLLNADGYRVWAIDQIGHGHTEGCLADAYPIDPLAKNGIALLELVASQNGGLPIILGGHSMGGVTSSVIASMKDRPAFKGLFLTGTPLHFVPCPDDITERVMATEEQYLDELAVDPLLPQEEIDFKALWDGFHVVQDRMAPQFKSWNFPVLLISGEHDPVAPPKFAREWIKEFPHGRYVEITDGHHDIINDWCFHTTAKLISNFVFESITDEIVK